jgi:alkylation response protein AidB-like acyl-CoA dehydrogenase
VTDSHLDRARRVAEEVLFPAAAAVDRAERVPEEHFEALAAQGFYNIGSLDRPTLGALVETFAGACLATAFVWIQHRGSLQHLPQVRPSWLSDLATGRKRGGIARAGARPGGLEIRTVDGGYVLDGRVPWVTGWGLVDVLQVGAFDPADGQVRFLLMDVVDAPSLSAERLELSAANASRTTTLTFSEHFVGADRFTHALPLQEWQRGEAPGSALNGFLALGVASRCVSLLAASPAAPALSAEVDRCRADLLAADAASTPAARAAASELAARAAGTLAVHSGSRSVLRGGHPERLVREAAFLLVFGTRPAIRDRLLPLVAAPPPAAGACA